MMIHRNMARRKNLAMKAVASKPVKKEEKREDKPLVSEFTREEVEKMPYMKLRSVAKKNGIDTDNLDAKEVRSTLIEKLGL